MHKFMILGSLTLALSAGSALAQTPDYYPADYAKIVEGGKAEGRVILYSPLGASDIGPLIADFQTLYKGITVEDVDLNTAVLYNRFISEVAADSASADLVWSSAPDLQAKLIDDGYALVYNSPEIAKIPSWAYWDKGGFGTTFEPFLSIYNKDVIKDAPKTHADIVKLLNGDGMQGKVASYNIETSGVGFYGISQDAKSVANFADIEKAFGKVKVRLYSSNGEMIESVASGENLFAYDLPGFFAAKAAQTNTSIGVVYPEDHLTIGTRVAFVNAKAPHPNAAQLFMDYLISARGQKIIADLGFFSMRDDVEGAASAKTLKAKFGANAKDPSVSATLLEYLDPAKRSEFLDGWKQALRGE